MKSLIRSFAANAFAIWLISKVVTGLSYSNNIKILLFAGVVFGLVNIFIRPIVKLLMLPINILTIGLFSWVVNVLMLYITVLVVEGFEVSAFHFPGYEFQGFNIPSGNVSTLWAAILASFGIGLIDNLLRWFME